ncbi:MAG: DUF4136 domain-containing protein [Flavobacteriales bacterium]
MRWKYLTSIAFLAGLTSCALTQTSFDYDETAHFSRYETFAFYKSGMDKLKISDLDKRRIINEIVQALTAKGMRFAKKPDIYVNVSMRKSDRIDVVTQYPYYSWGVWWGYPGGFGWDAVQTRTYRVGSLYIDLIDAEKKQLVWQGKGVAQMPGDLSKKAAYIKGVVREILSQYPPGKR